MPRKQSKVEQAPVEVADANAVYEVIVDQLGAMGDWHRGDTLSAGDEPGWNLVDLERRGAVRRVDANAPSPPASDPNVVMAAQPHRETPAGADGGPPENLIV